MYINKKASCSHGLLGSYSFCLLVSYRFVEPWKPSLKLSANLSKYPKNLPSMSQKSPKHLKNIIAHRAAPHAVQNTNQPHLGHTEQYLTHLKMQTKHTSGTSSSTSHTSKDKPNTPRAHRAAPHAPEKHKPNIPRAHRAPPHAPQNTSQTQLAHIEQHLTHLKRQAKHSSHTSSSTSCPTTCVVLSFFDLACPFHLPLLWL